MNKIRFTFLVAVIAVAVLVTFASESWAIFKPQFGLGGPSGCDFLCSLFGCGNDDPRDIHDLDGDGSWDWLGILFGRIVTAPL